MKPSRTNRYELQQRIDRAEEMLCSGINPSRVERTMASEYGITPRHARRYIAAAYKRWQEQTIHDAPHRREKIIRMAERFYARALADKEYTAAVSTLALLARMSGAFTPYDPQRAAQVAELGPPPQDPTQALVWAQRCMLFALNEVVTNPAIDPERRLRWIAELGSKLGMTHAKVLVEHKLEQIERRVAGPEDKGADEMTPASGIAWPETSRFGSGDPGGGTRS